MKIELKKISFNERMSEETNCFVADLYINGKKIGYCKNQGHGGCTDYNGYTPEDRKTIAEAEEYFKTLPKVKAEGYDFEFQPTLENAIDESFEDWLKAKETKKMEKLMQTALLFGRPNGGGYKYYQFKKPLSEIPVQHLQTRLNVLVMENCKKGVQVLNTNLNTLGLVIN